MPGDPNSVVSSERWKYVGEGNGSYAQLPKLEYVGEGQGNIERETKSTGRRVE